jgi:hypothetical protein
VLPREACWASPSPHRGQTQSRAQRRFRPGSSGPSCRFLGSAAGLGMRRYSSSRVRAIALCSLRALLRATAGLGASSVLSCPTATGRRRVRVHGVTVPGQPSAKLPSRLQPPTRCCRSLSRAPPGMLLCTVPRCPSAGSRALRSCHQPTAFNALNWEMFSPTKVQ